jgi:hypothetical protein
MRPRYETADDRQRQREAVYYLSAATGTTAVETPPLTRWDYEMVRDGRVLALVEVKFRKCSSATYPTFMVSEGKATTLRDHAIASGCAGGFLVNWIDAAGWLRIDTLVPDGWSVGSGGRCDRGDPMDVERVVHFPIDGFRFIDRAAGAWLNA